MRRIAAILAALGLVNIAVRDLAPRCEPGATHAMAAMRAMVVDGPTFNQAGNAPCAPGDHGPCHGMSMLGCSSTCATTANGLDRSVASARAISPKSLAVPRALIAFAAWRPAPEPPPPRPI